MARATDLLVGSVLRNYDFTSSLLAYGYDHDPAAATREFRKKYPWAVRAALEKTFEYWLKNFAPLHFTRKAFQRYPEQYSRNYKQGFGFTARSGRNRLAWEIMHGKNTDKPLVKTGDMKQQFLHGSYRFTGSNKNLTAKWTSLPHYAYPYRKNQTKKALAMVEVNNAEMITITDVFEMFLDEELATIDKSKKTFGRIAI